MQKLNMILNQDWNNTFAEKLPPPDTEKELAEMYMPCTIADTSNQSGYKNKQTFD